MDFASPTDSRFAPRFPSGGALGRLPGPGLSHHNLREPYCSIQDRIIILALLFVFPREVH